MKLIYKISEDGFLIYGQEIILEDDETVASGYIEQMLPQDENGMQKVLYKAKWNGLEWIEGATQEEIDELTNVESSPPTEIELLKEKIKQLEQEKNALSETLDMILTELIPNLTGGN